MGSHTWRGIQAIHGVPTLPAEGVAATGATGRHVTRPTLRPKATLNCPRLVPFSHPLLAPGHWPPTTIPYPGVADETTRALTVSSPSAPANNVRYTIVPVT